MTECIIRPKLDNGDVSSQGAQHLEAPAITTVHPGCVCGELELGCEEVKSLHLPTKSFYALKILSHKHRCQLKGGHRCPLVWVRGETFSEGGQDKWLNSTLLMRFKKVLSGFQLEKGHMALGSLGAQAKPMWSLIPRISGMNYGVL